MSGAQPTATGTFASTPLPHLLVHVLDRRRTGTLVIEEPGGAKSAIFLAEGIPANAKTNDPVITLGALLVEMGAIDPPTFQRTLARVAQEKRLHGEILLSEQALDQDTLLEALREQLERKLEWMFTLPAACVFGFYEGQNFLERWGGRERPRVSPLALLTRGLRRGVQEPHVAATLSRLGSRPLKLHLDSRIGLFELGPHEKAVTDLLRAKPMSIDVLVQSGVGGEDLVRRVIYLLTITRHLELGIAGQRPVGIESAPPVRGGEPPRSHTASFAAVVFPDAAAGAVTPAASPKPPGAGSAARVEPGPEARARMDEMRARADALAKETYYQILGVAPDVDKGTIQAAFFQLAKQWHPDRLTGEMVEIREVASRAFARMSEAHQILTDPQRRAEYDGLLQDGGGSAEEQEKIACVLRAVGHHQKAEVLLKKGNLAEAEVEAQAAVQSDPDQPEYTVLLAWILAQKPERAQSGKYADLIHTLSAVIAKNQEHQRARLYRAHLLKRAGEVDKAMRDFAWVAEHDPKNVEAAREIRLYRMRQGGEQTGSSLLGKLFKR